MKYVFKLLCSSFLALIFAWIAKFYFVYGGDYLFRTATCGILIVLFFQLFITSRDRDLIESKLRPYLILNLLCLLIVYTGMMFKVSHIFVSQTKKDLLLDFIGIPAIAIALIYTFSSINRLMNSTKRTKELILKQVIFPWIIFGFSFLLYAVYSIILVRA